VTANQTAWIRQCEENPDLWYRSGLGFDNVFDFQDRVRAKMAGYINGGFNDTVFVDNASNGVNAVLRSQGLAHGVGDWYGASHVAVAGKVNIVLWVKLAHHVEAPVEKSRPQHPAAATPLNVRQLGKKLTCDIAVEEGGEVPVALIENEGARRGSEGCVVHRDSLALARVAGSAFARLLSRGTKLTIQVVEGANCFMVGSHHHAKAKSKALARSSDDDVKVEMGRPRTGIADLAALHEIVGKVATLASSLNNRIEERRVKSTLRIQITHSSNYTVQQICVKNSTKVLKHSTKMVQQLIKNGLKSPNMVPSI
jgi:hypothetical protein